MTVPLLLEYFDMLISRPEDVEKLNSTILDLAIHGKLGTNNPNDESANTLLENISKQKQSKQTKKKVREETETVSLPNNWTSCLITELFDVMSTRGKQLQTKEYLESGKYPIVSQGKELITAYSNADDLVTHIEHPVVIFGDHTREVKYIDFDFIVGADGVKILNPIQPLNEKYFYLVVKSIDVESRGYARHFKKLTESLIPLPPLPEQQRIVDRVEELFAQTHLLAEQLSHSRTELDRLNQSALAHLLASETSEEFNERWCFIAEHFDLLTSAPEHIAPLRQSILELAVRGKLTRREAEDEPAKELLKQILVERRKYFESNPLRARTSNDSDPVSPDTDKLPELPEGWLWVRAEQVCGFITKGTTPSADKLFSGAGEIPFIKVYNLTFSGDLDFSINPTFVSQETHDGELARSRAIPGDVLMNIVGPPLGKVSIVPPTYPEWNVNQAIAIFRPIKGMSRKFLSLTLLEHGILEWAVQQEVGTAGQSNLSLEVCRNLPLPLPPLAEQERIVKRVEQLLGWCDALEAQLKSAEEERGRLVESVLARVGGQYGE